MLILPTLLILILTVQMSVAAPKPGFVDKIWGFLSGKSSTKDKSGGGSSSGPALARVETAGSTSAEAANAESQGSAPAATSVETAGLAPAAVASVETAGSSSNKKMAAAVAKAGTSASAKGSATRIMQEYKILQNEAAKNSVAEEIGLDQDKKDNWLLIGDKFAVKVNEQDIYLWEIKLKKAAIAAHSELAADLEKLASGYSQDYIHLEMKFPDNFPMAPPFVRVLSPVFIQGTAHVMAEGLVCMELLTPQNWRPVTSVEGLITLIAQNMVDGKGRIAFGESAVNKYSQAGAKLAYERFKKNHPDWFQ